MKFESSLRSVKKGFSPPGQSLSDPAAGLQWTSKAKVYRHWGSVQAVRPIGGSRGIALLFHDHGTRRGWGVSVTPRPYFTPGKDSVPIVQEAVWVPGPVWTGAENLAAPPGFDPRTVQPVASRYTDYATRPTELVRRLKKKNLLNRCSDH